MLLYPGYTLESFGNSEITLVFSDESILRLEENSRVTLTQSSENNGGINIEYGNIWARVIKPLFTQDSFKIESESISLAVRGTSVYLQKTQNSQLTAYVVDSYVNKGTQSLKLTNSISGEDINLSAGEKYNSSDQTIA